MCSMKRNRGPEWKEYVDAKTGHTIQQLTDNKNIESKHNYYDVCPWSSDGKYILFSSAVPEEVVAAYKVTLSTENGAVCIMDTQSGEISTIAEGGLYNTHNGTFPIWHPSRNLVYYRRKRGLVGIVDIDEGTEITIKGSARQISPDGNTLVSTPNEVQLGDELGIYTMKSDGSDFRCIANMERIYEETPNRDEFDLKEMTISNTKWSPDGRHILVAMTVSSKPQVHRSIYIVSSDGSSVRWLSYFAHHHSWSLGGKQVLFNDWHESTGADEDRTVRMHLINFDGSGKRVVIDEPMGSHPLMDPTGRMISDYDDDGIYVVHVKEKRVERLAAYRNDYDRSHHGTQPHCVWNKDGTQLLYNSAETGHSEIYLVRMEN